MSGDKGLTPFHLEFQDNDTLRLAVGPGNTHLKGIERRLGVKISLCGNVISLEGAEPEIFWAQNVIKALYAHAQANTVIEKDELEGFIQLSIQPFQSEPQEILSIPTRRRVIFPRSSVQAAYIKGMSERDLVFGIGPAGTGKTYLAVAVGISLLLQGKVDRLILSRPAVEAGERLGFLPGNLKEKVDPYLRPLYDALNDMLPPDQVEKRFVSGEIEVAPLAFMRGRTLSNAFVILDEAQNTTALQMKMFLTRLGANSKMVITGDLTQIDLPPHVQSGLYHALEVLNSVSQISFVKFSEKDVVRHALVSKIIEAYDAFG